MLAHNLVGDRTAGGRQLRGVDHACILRSKGNSGARLLLEPAVVWAQQHRIVLREALTNLIAPRIVRRPTPGEKELVFLWMHHSHSGGLDQ